eukprot:gene17036-6000_t
MRHSNTVALAAAGGACTEASPACVYHPALHLLTIMNEPEFHSRNDWGIGSGGTNMARAMASALDGILAAEEEAKMQGSMIRLTATHSFATCPDCLCLTEGTCQKNFPGSNYMVDIYRSIFFGAPGKCPKINYMPRCKAGCLVQAYRSRWTNSMNTQNTAPDLLNMFLPEYIRWARAPPSTEFVPLYITEYHATSIVGTAFEHDLSAATRLVGTIDGAVDDGTPFYGLNMFQFQRAYNKPQAREQNFGVFALGSQVLGGLCSGGPQCEGVAPAACNRDGCMRGDVYCLATDGRQLPEAVAAAYGGD